MSIYTCTKVVIAIDVGVEIQQSIDQVKNSKIVKLYRYL